MKSEMLQIPSYRFTFEYNHWDLSYDNGGEREKGHEGELRDEWTL